MLTNPTAGRRITGRLLVLATVAVALPLTATRAINYIDLPAPAEPPAPATPVVAAAQPAPVVQPSPVVAPTPPSNPAQPTHISGDGKITLNGRTKEWRELNPEEKAEIRQSIAEAKEELKRNRIDRQEIEREIREAMDDVKIDQEELKRELAEARAEVERAIKEIDSDAVEIRRSGQDPEKLKAQIRASMRAVDKIDVEAITRQALASVDHNQISASIAAAEASIERAQQELDQLEVRYRDDD